MFPNNSLHTRNHIKLWSIFWKCLITRLCLCCSFVRLSIAWFCHFDCERLCASGDGLLLLPVNIWKKHFSVNYFEDEESRGIFKQCLLMFVLIQLRKAWRWWHSHWILIFLMLSLDKIIVELIVIARLGFVASKSPSVDHMKLSVPVCVGTAFIPTSQTLSFYLTRLPSFKQPKPCQSLHPNRLFCQIHFPEVVIHMILPRKNEKNGNNIEIYLVFWVRLVVFLGIGQTVIVRGPDVCVPNIKSTS